MKKICKFLRSNVCIGLSVILTTLIVYFVRQIRVVQLGSYKLTNALSLVLLLLCAVNVFFVYKDPDADTPALFKETIPAIIMFVGFVICKMCLRGAA